MSITPLHSMGKLPLAISAPEIATENWRRYVQRVVGKMSRRDIAHATCIPRGRVDDWIESPPSGDDVLSFAQCFGVSPWEALNSAGLIQDRDVDVRAHLAAFGSHELLHELDRRRNEYNASLAQAS